MDLIETREWMDYYHDEWVKASNELKELKESIKESEPKADVDKISLYVTKKTSTESIIKQLENELIQANKIKDEEHRTNVVCALYRICEKLLYEGRRLEKGKVFFANGWKVWVYPYFGNKNLYWVDDEFYTNPLKWDIEQQVGHKSVCKYLRSFGKFKDVPIVEKDIVIKDWIK